MTKSFNPRHLDVGTFAQAAGSLSGQESLQKYERVAQDLHAPKPDLMLNWKAQGEHRRAADGSVRPALHLQVQTTVPLTCQRCLGEVLTQVDVDSHFIFVPDEDTAAALDDESEDDVLVQSSDFDLKTLIEDEVLMALPLVPRHEQCPTDLAASAKSAGFDASEEARPTPFAVLAALKTQKE